MARLIVMLGMGIIFIFSGLGIADEQLTITTYYPSPYGSYNELTTTGNTYLATNSGNVGIGTAMPKSPAPDGSTTGNLDTNDIYLRSTGKWASNTGVKSFVGATPGSYHGIGVGGYDGGDAKCAAQYGSGARMSIASDFANGRPNVDGWYNYFGPHDIVFSSDHRNDCAGWTVAYSTYTGLYWSVSLRRGQVGA